MSGTGRYPDYGKAVALDRGTAVTPSCWESKPILSSGSVVGPGSVSGRHEATVEGVVSKRIASRYRSGLSRSWLKTKNMVESEFVLLGIARDSDGVPWALLASDRDGELKFAGSAILRPPQAQREIWRQQMAALAVAKPPLKGLRQGSAQWLRPELRVRVRHLNTKGVLRHATVRQLIMD